MGFTVVFWSPVSGQAGTTSNLIAAAALLGLEYSSRLLLLGHLQSEYAAIERSFYPRRGWMSKADTPPDAGIDSLLRLLQNRKLEPNRLRDYTLPLLADRLDILPGSNKPDASFVSAAQEWLAPLLELTRRAYDLVLLAAEAATCRRGHRRCCVRRICWSSVCRKTRSSWSRSFRWWRRSFSPTGSICLYSDNTILAPL